MAVTPTSRVLTGLPLVAIGGLLWLALQGQVWAGDLVHALSPLLILVTGFCVVMIASDGAGVAGKVGIVTGLVLLVLARLAVLPETALHTVGALVFVLVGLAIALSAGRVPARGGAADSARERAGSTRNAVGTQPGQKPAGRLNNAPGRLQASAS